MPTVTIRPQARIDMAGIWAYIAQDSEPQADKFIDRIDRQLAKLALQPAIGRLRNELVENLRSFPFERYLLFYQITTEGIDVARVLHGARDIDAQFTY